MLRDPVARRIVIDGSAVWTLVAGLQLMAHPAEAAQWLDLASYPWTNRLFDLGLVAALLAACFLAMRWILVLGRLARRWHGSPGESSLATASRGTLVVEFALVFPLVALVFILVIQLALLANAALVIASIVLAGLVAVATFGNETYFGMLRVQDLSWSILLPGLLVALVSGLTGGLFARLIIVSLRGLPGRVRHVPFPNGGHARDHLWCEVEMVAAAVRAEGAIGRKLRRRRAAARAVEHETGDGHVPALEIARAVLRPDVQRGRQFRIRALG